MTRNTSLEAYYSIVDRMAPGLRQAICRLLLQHNEPMTTSEIAQGLGKPRDSVSPRMKELINRDLVKECGERPCRVTGTNKITFWMTGHQEAKVSNQNKRPSKAELEAELARVTRELVAAIDGIPISRPHFVAQMQGCKSALTWVLHGGPRPIKDAY